MGNTSQLKIGSILSYLQMFLNIAIGLIYTPIMIRLLGRSEYGLYNTVASTISMLSLLSLGFNSSYIRFYAKYRKEDNKQKIYSLNGLFLIIFLIIGCIALLCGLFLTTNLNIVFSDGLTSSEYEIAKVLMLLLSIQLAESFLATVFTNIISAHEKFVFLKLVNMLKTIGSPLVTLPLLLLGYKSIAMVSVSLVITLISDGINIFFVISILKERFVFNNFEKGLFSNIFVYTSFIAINMIVDQVNNNVDKLLLARFKGTSEVAIYSVGFSLYNYYSMFSTSISGVFTPRIHSIINQYDGSQLRITLTDMFVKVGRIQYMLLALIVTGYVFWGKQFITTIWAGPDYENSYYVGILLMLPATVPLIQNVGIEIQRAQNLHRFRSIIYIIMATLNLVLSIYLCQKYGAIGSTIGTAISLVVANGFIMNVFYHKKCNIDMMCFWKNIYNASIGLIIPVITGFFMVSFFSSYNRWSLLLQILVYILIYCISIWRFSLNKFEKELFSGVFVKIRNRLVMK